MSWNNEILTFGGPVEFGEGEDGCGGEAGALSGNKSSETRKGIVQLKEIQILGRGKELIEFYY